MTTRSRALDQMEKAHRSVGGTGPGRQYATQQINQAYAVSLPAHFQGFCRELHDECADRLVGAVSPPSLQPILREALVEPRKLDTGNPNPGNIGSDFGRFGLTFWAAVKNHDARNEAGHARLEELSRWRNAIAHQNINPAVLGGTTLRLRQVKGWRQACHRLAASFDEVMRSHIQSLLGVSPW